VSDQVCGKTRGPVCHRETWWWNEYTEKAGEKKSMYII